MNNDHKELNPKLIWDKDLKKFVQNPGFKKYTHNSNKDQSKTLYFMLALIIFVGGCYRISCYHKDPLYTNEQKDSISTANFINSNKTMAYVMSQEFVKKTLKAPSTADFPMGSDEYCQYVGDSTFAVNSYVDSQNSFGAMIRSNYHVVLKFNGDHNWSLIKIKIDN